ncbi:MAG: DUF2797 domain-containing protein [Bacteriovorax sp.]|jgi:hypothetical protein
MQSFNLDKMQTSLIEGMAHYKIGPDECPVELNPLIGQELKLIFKKEINCTNCYRPIKKTYAGGYCYPCSAKLAEADMCILRPELCHFTKGTCRDPEWGTNNCMIPHYVYLANSSGLKVGITRSTQIPTRWIDQGAIAGLPILKVSSRYQSGMFEKMFSSKINDKTDWRKMLKGDIEEISLKEKRDELFLMFGEALDEMEGNFGASQVEILERFELTSINYPVLTYPEKVSSLSFDKTEIVGGKLLGIKGQYLMFDTGVINIRNHTGYKIDLQF